MKLGILLVNMKDGVMQMEEGGFADRMLLREPSCFDQLVAMYMGWA